jgi:hypothetical protein
MGVTDPAGHGVAAEPDRVSTRVVLRFGVIVAALSVVAMLLMAALFKLLERGAVLRDTASIDAAGLERREDRLPPAPRLQIHGTRDWQEFRSAEAAHLTTYGWMDRATGVVHIPIEAAMDLVAQRGVAPLPSLPAAVPASAAPRAPGGRP